MPPLPRPPDFADDGLWRQRVVDRLQQAAAARLVFLTAPAGFGKTTALRQWASQQQRGGHAVAWVRCDERHKDADFFTESLAASLQASLPAGTPAPSPSLALVPWLAQWPHATMVCVDEFESASSQAVDALLEQLAQALPAQVCLVLASREAPGRRFTRLELSGQARLVDADLLRFTRDEALQLLSDTLPAGAAAQIVSYADGWPFALQLARLRARSEAGGHAPGWELSPQAKIPRRQMFDYLAEEVMASLPAPVLAFLGDVAVLDEVTVAGANALRQASDSLGLIRQLARLAPIVTLDDSLQSARLHPLLRDYMCDAVELSSPGRLAQLHLRAAHHLAEQGQLHQAVSHAVQGGRLDVAADILEAAGAIRLVANEGALRSRLLLQQLPEATLRRRPRLRLLQLGWQVGNMDPAGAAVEFERIERQIHDTESGASEADLLDLAAARCVMLVHQSERQADFSPWAVLTQAHRLARANAAEDQRPLAIVLAIDIFMLHRYGPADRAERRTREVQAAHASGAYTYNSPWLWMYRARNDLARGDLPAAEEQLQRWLVNDTNHRNYRQDSLDQLAAAQLGHMAQLRGDTEVALAHFASLHNAQPAHMLEILHAAHVQAAACEFGLGHGARAMDMLDAARQLADDEDLQHLGLLAAAMQVELLARSGDAPAAHERSQANALDAAWAAAQHPFAQPWLCVQGLARACFELHLVAAEHDSADGVALQLQSLAAKTGQRLGEVNAAWMLLRVALARGATRAVASAHDAALQANAVSPVLAYALEGGAPVVLHLRNWLYSQRDGEASPQAAWVQALLARWEASFAQRAQAGARGGLTPRELGVLCELAQEGSTKLIARKLMLSPETVKHHLKGIYSKLGVGSRDAAVAEARRRQLLP